jgi:hypothetical protein
MVVEQHANPGMGRILGFELCQQSDEIGAGAAVRDDLGNPAGMQIQARQ